MFRDRTEAGEKLAEALAARDLPDPVVLALPRGGVPVALPVARRLAARGIECTVLDLRWLAPLPVDAIAEELARTGRALLVDETRRTGGVAEGIMAALLDRGVRAPLRRVAAVDSFIPLGEAARHVLVSEELIEAAALELRAET